MSKSPPIVAEEERLLDTVLASIRRLRASAAPVDHAAELVKLRDSLADEKLPEDIASIMEAMDRTAALMAQQASHQRGSVNPARPYFGHMVLDDDHGRRSILIGAQTFISDRVRIVDWRNAPISRLFYQYAEGDEYEERVNGFDVSGVVEARRSVRIEESKLRRVSDHDHTWVRDEVSGWRDRRAMEAKLAGGTGTAVRPESLGTASAVHGDKHLRQITSLLDPEQFDLITRPESGVVVIHGSAGSGKTTVALHRIAYLNFLEARGFRPNRMLVLAFSKALTAYIKKVLPALGVEGVRVTEFHRWVEWLRKMHFRGLPKTYHDDTPALVTRFKTHPSLLPMIDEAAAAQPDTNPMTLFDELFTDLTWLKTSAKKHAPGAFSDKQLQRIHRWCTDQHYIRVDGTGVHDDEVPSLDREDDAILLRLYQQLRGALRLVRGKKGRGPYLRYDHIMVDETQDLCALELAVILGTTNQRRSVTLAGDHAQSIAVHRDTTQLSDVLKTLGMSHVAVSPLQVSYRSTRQIMEVAHEILGPLAPNEAVTTTRIGAPVAHLAFTSTGEAVTYLAEALTDVARREPLANIACVTASTARAVAWFDVLDRAEVPGLALVTDQEFSFAPGIELTDIRSTKGLEFDYVIVLSADASEFPDSPDARHLLYVGATRAAHQLWFVSTGNPSPLIPAELAGLLG